MTKDDKLGISRRSVLAGLGTVGVASAGAGLGTSAYFGDTESFENNVLVAGELDLKVDWQQTYYGPSESSEPVNAYPDTDGDGIQDEVRTREEIATSMGSTVDDPNVETTFRDQFADVPRDFAGPLVELDDVKPGDHGRVCFSLHLFDNPGYVWLTADGYDQSENGINEPEGSAGGEDGTSAGELGDEVMVKVYYDDDGDCEHDAGEQLIFGPGIAGYTGWDGAKPATLSAAMEVMGRNGGYVPLDGDGNMGFDAGDTAPERDCFVNSTTKYVTFEWWLPWEVGNHVQSDSLSFDLGFYTQQCRHSDGSLEIETGTDCVACDADAASFSESPLVDVQSVDATSFPDVSVFARVDTTAGDNGELVEDFVLCENGFAQDVTTTFTEGSAVDIAFVLDDTASMGGAIDTMKNNIVNFANTLSGLGIDGRYALVTFKDSVEVDTDFTDASTLQTILTGVTSGGGGDTPEDNFDAIVEALGLSYRPGAQKVVVSISGAESHFEGDGDGISDHTLGETATAINDAGATFVAVSPDDDDPNASQKVLANTVGGRWIEFSNADFGVILDDIEEQVTTTYTIGYTTCKDEADGTARDVLLRVTDPVEGELAAKPGYTAPSS